MFCCYFIQKENNTKGIVVKIKVILINPEKGHEFSFLNSLAITIIIRNGKGEERKNMEISWQRSKE
jgi:hypothetical protein